MGPNVGPAAMAAMPEAVHMNPVPLAASIKAVLISHHHQVSREKCLSFSFTIAFRQDMLS